MELRYLDPLSFEPVADQEVSGGGEEGALPLIKPDKQKKWFKQKNIIICRRNSLRRIIVQNFVKTDPSAWLL